MRHLIDITDFSRAELDRLLRLGLDITQSPNDFNDSARGKILATLFFEPSTRTRLSFESAMMGLGGGVLGISEGGSSSAVKGESVGDTIRTVGCYSDIIAMRHPLEGAAMMGALHAGVPVINAGDGGHSHPSQTLTDLLTLLREKGTIGGLHIGMCGDLKYGRTVHSLINALAGFEGVKITLISPAELAVPEYIRRGKLAGMQFCETESLTAALPGLDVLYMTRIQKERFEDADEYERLKDLYILDSQKMKLARKDAVVLHPLPRVNEISTEVDRDPRAAYFRQVQYGRYVRMALIKTLLFRRMDARLLYQPQSARTDMVCANPKCVTRHIADAKQIFVPEGSGWKCLYCEGPHAPDSAKAQ